MNTLSQRMEERLRSFPVPEGYVLLGPGGSDLLELRRLAMPPINYFRACTLSLSNYTPLPTEWTEEGDVSGIWEQLLYAVSKDSPMAKAFSPPCMGVEIDHNLIIL